MGAWPHPRPRHAGPPGGHLGGIGICQVESEDVDEEGANEGGHGNAAAGSAKQQERPGLQPLSQQQQVALLPKAKHQSELPIEVGLQLPPEIVFGALSFVCTGRGEKFFGDPHVESGLVAVSLVQGGYILGVDRWVRLWPSVAGRGGFWRVPKLH